MRREALRLYYLCETFATDYQLPAETAAEHVLYYACVRLLHVFVCFCRQSLLYARCAYIRVNGGFECGDNFACVALWVLLLHGFVCMREAYYLYCWGIALASNVAHATGTQATTTTTTKTSRISLSASIVFASYGTCYMCCIWYF